MTDAPAPGATLPAAAAASTGPNDAALELALRELGAGDDEPAKPAAAAPVNGDDLGDLMAAVVSMGLTLLVEWQAPTMPAEDVDRHAAIREPEKKLLAKVAERLPAVGNLPTGPLVLVTLVVIALPRIAVARAYNARHPGARPPRVARGSDGATDPPRPTATTPAPQPAATRGDPAPG